MEKEADLLFAVTVGIPFWRMGEHKHLIFAVFLPIVSRRDCRGPWKIRWIELVAGTIITLEREF